MAGWVQREAQQSRKRSFLRNKRCPAASTSALPTMSFHLQLRKAPSLQTHLAVGENPVPLVWQMGVHPPQPANRRIPSRDGQLPLLREELPPLGVHGVLQAALLLPGTSSPDADGVGQMTKSRGVAVVGSWQCFLPLSLSLSFSFSVSILFLFYLSLSLSLSLLSKWIRKNFIMSGIDRVFYQSSTIFLLMGCKRGSWNQPFRQNIRLKGICFQMPKAQGP